MVRLRDGAGQALLQDAQRHRVNPVADGGKREERRSR